MHDIGFTPERNASPIKAVRTVVRGAVDGGLRNRPVRWLMLTAPFSVGVAFYAFYALQPYLLELFGDPNAYGIAGLAAALVAGMQVVGGLLVARVRRLFARRTHALILGAVASVVLLVLIGVNTSFWVVIALVAIWCLVGAIEEPMRRAFINPLIPSQQRATVLSFDSLLGSAGGVVIQPTLGRSADLFGYGMSYVVAAGIQALAIPFAVLARVEDASSDRTDVSPEEESAAAA
jgi:MFS family permease